MQDTEAPEDRSPRRKSPRTAGRDELNLAEFPIAALSDRLPKGCKTLRFEDEIRDKATGAMVKRTLTITGSDAYGLPTAGDEDVIVGLIQITKDANRFTDPKVNFTRYELLRLLGWPLDGRHYRRLDDSLSRWLGVSLHYDKAWWRNDVKAWVTEKFHILDNVSIIDPADRPRIRAAIQQEFPFSYFKWNEVVFRSFQAEYLKALDLTVYFSLSSATAKRIYRYIDKHSHHGRHTFALHTLAFEKIGLSRNYNTGQIKAKLQPALEELEAIGVLESMNREERYTLVRRGEWTITLARKAGGKPKPEPSGPPTPEPTQLELELSRRGVTPATAAELATSFPVERIAAQVEVFDWLSERKDKRITKNPAGYLVESIRKDYAAPKGFVSRADREKQEAEKRERQRAEAEARRLKAEQDARSQEERRKIAAFIDSLSGQALADFDAEALKHAAPENRATFERFERQPVGRAVLRLIRETHARRKLGLPPAPEDTH